VSGSRGEALAEQAWVAPMPHCDNLSEFFNVAARHRRPPAASPKGQQPPVTAASPRRAATTAPG
jgi:hypothetical protein